MKTLYLECRMGAAGDMLMSALLELRGGRDDFLRRLNGAGIPNVIVTAEPSKKRGIVGTRVRVAVGGREEGSELPYGNDGDNDGNGGNNHERGGHIHDGVSHHHDEHHHDVHYNDEPHHAHNDYRHNNHDNEHHQHHSHRSYHDIEHLIDSLNINDTVKKNSLVVYKLLAEAESAAHGAPVDKIHFHEVGEADAVADIVGVCMLMDELAPDIILASPVNLGGGHVRCAHGLLPVPAPATANILRGVPVYSDTADGELCTPTGAALLKHFVREFRDMPVMRVNKIGYGMGKKDFEKANCLRAYIGEFGGIGKTYKVSGVNDANAINRTDNISNNIKINNADKTDSINDTDGIDAVNEEYIAELSCNLDDMTPEAVSFAQQLLLDEGALDVYTTPAGMKKGRAGLIFTCLCRVDDREKMLRLIFKHTTTLGIREYVINRYILKRYDTEIQTSLGPVRIKTAHGFGVKKTKPEYEDIARLAREKGMSIEDVLARM